MNLPDIDPGVPAHNPDTADPPALQVEQATLFLTDAQATAPDAAQRLAQTLARLQVRARHARVVDLLAHPLLGRQCRVRVTPCLVLDTGGRLVTIPGDPQQLTMTHLETALASTARP